MYDPALCCVMSCIILYCTEFCRCLHLQEYRSRYSVTELRIKDSGAYYLDDAPTLLPTFYVHDTKAYLLSDLDSTR